MAVLAIGLLARRTEAGAEAGASVSNLGQVAGASALLFGYLLLWGTGLFAARTAIFLLLSLRFLGQAWIPAAGYAAVVTAFVHLAFDTGLNVSLE